MLVGFAIQRWHSVLDIDLGSGSSGNGFENHLESKTIGSCDVHHHRLGSVDHFAVGVRSCRFHQFVVVCPGWHRVHRWRGAVLYEKTFVSSARIWLSRNLACFYGCGWGVAVHRSWIAGCSRCVGNADQMSRRLKNLALGELVCRARRKCSIGSLAQLVEQRTFNPQVQGSSPWRPTIGYS